MRSRLFRWLLSEREPRGARHGGKHRLRRMVGQQVEVEHVALPSRAIASRSGADSA